MMRWHRRTLNVERRDWVCENRPAEQKVKNRFKAAHSKMRRREDWRSSLTIEIMSTSKGSALSLSTQHDLKNFK
ncbi:hypothetical protein PM082_021277 [Marasmius tenuissimus]|nr:hypothetical protein PM082_021277 [Marasmius tenuissimus]